MKLKIKQTVNNSFHLKGILIKGSVLENWIKEIQGMGLSLSTITVYPVPGTIANTLWGCLVVYDPEKYKTSIGRNTYCQLVHQLLFIPEKSVIFPLLSPVELSKLLQDKLHIFHPEFGMVLLEEAVDWKEVIMVPKYVDCEVRQPVPSVFIPMQVKSFQVQPVSTEEALSTFEEKHFPTRQKFRDKPLNPFEKVKLFVYKQLFKKSGTTSDSGTSGVTKTPLLSILEAIKNFFSKQESDWKERIQSDFEELEKRNQKHIDKLLDLLKNNPAEALKYAIPLDTDGIGRGPETPMRFQLEKRWFDFSLFGDTDYSGGGGGVLPDNAFNQLQNGYWNTALEFIKQREYKKAAFIYMKLLKQYTEAARTLEDGGYYQEAASVYLKYDHNKVKAAECFEKGNMILQAIELYKELNNDEKVGDLYASIHKKEDASFHYQKVADAYIQNDQYLKASLLVRNKMENEVTAQALLLKGWQVNKDALNCLNNYFDHIHDLKQLENQLQLIYRNDINAANKDSFLRVLKCQFDKGNELAPGIKDMAYEIIVREMKSDPSMLTMLVGFNKDDKQFLRDTIRFKVNRRKV